MSRSGVQRTLRPQDRGCGDVNSRSWSRSNSGQSLGSRSKQGGSPLPSKLDCLHEKAERLFGAVVARWLGGSMLRWLGSFLLRIPLSLGSPRPARLFSCFVPAGYILVSLLFLLHGATVSKRRGNAAGMPGRPAHLVHTCTAYYSRSRSRPYEAWQHPIELTRTD